MIKFDLEALVPELKTVLKKKLEDEVRRLASAKIDSLFTTPRQVEYQKSHLRPGEKLDPDLGYGYRQVQAMVDDAILKADYITYCREFVEKKFQAAVDTALEEAIQQRARKLAFQAVDQKVNADKK